MRQHLPETEVSANKMPLRECSFYSGSKCTASSFDPFMPQISFLSSHKMNLKKNERSENRTEMELVLKLLLLPQRQSFYQIVTLLDILFSFLPQ